MIKYATAIRAGTATTEAILRRFTRAGEVRLDMTAWLSLSTGHPAPAPAAS